MLSDRYNRSRRMTAGWFTGRIGVKPKRSAGALIGLMLSISFSLCSPFPARAQGDWQQDDLGWRYIREDGSAASEGWMQIGDAWYWFETDGYMATGWLEDGGRRYYLDESGAMATGFRTIDGEFYYFHKDGVMNTGVVKIDETVYEMNDQGQVEIARKEKNTGGGPFVIGFYDSEAQWVADELNQWKQEDYDRQFGINYDIEEDDNKDHHKKAAFVVSARLSQIAAHRLEEARTRGYGNGKIPREGTLTDYLKTIGYRPSATCLEVYLRSCGDGGDAASRFEERYQQKEKRKFHAEYYSQLGIAHTVYKNRHYFMVVLMR